MTDPIDLLLQSFSLRARVIFVGKLCDSTNFDAGEDVAHMHIMRAGKLDIACPRGAPLEMREPALVFFPRPTNHRLIPVLPDGADLLCTSIEFGLGAANPLVQALPSLMVIPFAAAPSLKEVLDEFFKEALSSQQGRMSVLGRLAEVVLILAVRHGFAQGLLQSSMMAGIADPRLSKAILAMHSNPSEPWSLKQMADRAGMSRARFASHFTQVTGISAGDYLTRLRISIAQSLLIKRRSVKQVADQVGYSSSAALARAFSARTGRSPSAWLSAYPEAATVSMD